MSFPKPGVEQRDRLEAGRERPRTWKLRLAQWSAAVLGLLFFATLGFAYLARRDSVRAEAGLARAREVVDEVLSSVDRDPGRLDVDVPQVQRLRREMLQDAERFYRAFAGRESRSESARRALAFAHLRLGHINRMRERFVDAAREYQDAISRFKVLATAHPTNADERAALAEAYGWLGEVFRQEPEKYTDAEGAYSDALQVLQGLVQESPQHTGYQAALGRTYASRGIHRSSRQDLTQAASIDFREAIRVLEPLTVASDSSAQELARAYNNFGSLLATDPQRGAEVVALWEKAIAIDERLVIKDPGNRSSRLELALMCNRLAAVLNDRGKKAEAARRSKMAVDLIENLSRPAPALAIMRASAHNLRGMILQADDPAEALSEYEEALDLFERLQTDRDLHRMPEFHRQLGDLLLNLATFPTTSKNVASARRLLSDAVKLSAGVAAGIVSSGSRADAQTALDSMSRVLPSLPEPERAELSEFYRQLQRRLESDPARR